MPEQNKVTAEELKLLIDAASCWDEVVWSGGYEPDTEEELANHNKLAALLERLGERQIPDGMRYALRAHLGWV